MLRQTVAGLGADHIDRFFTQLAHDCQPGTTTRLCYLKPIDRFARHLVALDLRKDNPASEMQLRQTRALDEPTAIYLS
nr:hypothetical protein [Paraburkholderia sp. BL8N3]